MPKEETQYKPGESGNPKGRPPKLVSGVLKQLKSEGYESIKKSQVTDAYDTMVALPQDKLTDIGKDESNPMLFRILAKEILSKRGFEVVERMLDRSQGRPKNEITGDLEIKTALVEFIDDGKNKDTDTQ